jgi:DNA modification methylase
MRKSIIKVKTAKPAKAARRMESGNEVAAFPIQRIAIKDIRRAEYNPRVELAPGDPDYEKLRRSIAEFGLVEDLVYNARTGNLIGGHQRLTVLEHEFSATHVDVKVVDLPPAKEKALNVALNKVVGRWDDAKLAALLMELRLPDSGVDVASSGFDALEIDEALARVSNLVTDGQCDPDDIPAPPDKAITRPGDLWVLGDHRLLCGDSAKDADVDRLLDGQPIHLVNTDPPYNVRVERPLANDFVSDAAFEALLRAWFGNMARVLRPGCSFYVWGGYANVGNYPPVLRACGLYFSQALIWHKRHPVLTRKDFMGNHEWCFYGWREGAGHTFLGPNNATDVWDVQKVNPQSMIHLTEKPVELAVRAMQYSSRVGENVLDLFGGSGSTLIAAEELAKREAETPNPKPRKAKSVRGGSRGRTLIAAEQTGRRAFLMEVDPLYCDVIVARWERFTGRKAKREGSA